MIYVMMEIRNEHTLSSYFLDSQETSRFTTQFSANYKLGEAQTITLRNSSSSFERYININENIFVQARYVFQLNNHYTGDADIDIDVNSFTLGVGYRF